MKDPTPMSDNDVLTNLVVKQQEINAATAQRLGEISTSLADMTQFIKNVYAGYKTADEKIVIDLNHVGERVQSLETARRDTKRWLAGAVAVITTEAGAAAYLYHALAGKMSVILDVASKVKH
jgi:hypothetical protein